MSSTPIRKGISVNLSIKSLLEINGKLNFDNAITEYPFVFKKLYQRLNDNFHVSSFWIIGKNSSKLKTYALFKTEPGIEKYLIDIKISPCGKR